MNNPNQYPIGQTYRVSLTTGLITLITAATTTTAAAGHIGGFRWTSTTRDGLIQRVTATWSTISGFTGAQEVGMDLSVARGFTVDHDANIGDIPADFTGNNCKLYTKQPTSLMSGMSVSGTAVMSGGTFTCDAQPLDRCQMSELATGAGVYRGRMSLGWSPPPGCPPLRLQANEGLILRNIILMGAAGTARVTFAVDYTELPL